MNENQIKRRDDRIRRQLRAMRKNLEDLERELETDEKPDSLRDKSFDHSADDRARYIRKLRRQGVEF